MRYGYGGFGVWGMGMVCLGMGMMGLGYGYGGFGVWGMGMVCLGMGMMGLGYGIGIWGMVCEGWYGVNKWYGV